MTPITGITSSPTPIPLAHAPSHHDTPPNNVSSPPPNPPTSSSTPSDPRSARIEIWLDEVLRASSLSPPSHDPDHHLSHYDCGDHSPPAALWSPPSPPATTSSKKKGRAQILDGIRRLSRKLRRREAEAAEGEAGERERTAMYSLEDAGDVALVSEGSSEDPVEKIARRRGERLKRARRLLERSGQG